MERPSKKNHTDLLIVTPVWGAYDVTRECVEAIKRNTDRPFYHVLLNDNYEQSFREAGFEPDENHAFLDVYNDPKDSMHVEQIGKMMDLGLAFGKNFTAFTYLVKLETDCIVNPHWDTILIEEMLARPDCLMMEAYSVDTEPGKQAVPPSEQTTYPKDWCEMNLNIFSPKMMNFNWSFSATPHAVDQHLSRNIRTQSNECSIYETTKTWITHYRSSSRKNYD